MNHDFAAEPASSANRLPTGSTVRVLLVKPTRRDLSYDATVLFDDGDHIAITAPFAGADPLEFGYVTFDVGDQFTEHYWRSRCTPVALIGGRNVACAKFRTLRSSSRPVRRRTRQRSGVSRQCASLDRETTADDRDFVGSHPTPPPLRRAP